MISDAQWADLIARMQAWRESLDPAAPPPAPEPEPEPTPEPVPSSPVVMRGANGSTALNFDHGPDDIADAAVLQAAIDATPPWSVFTDAIQTISPSRNSQRATAFVKLHVYGNMNGLYRRVPAFMDGLHRQIGHSHLYTPGADFSAFLKTYGARPGPRGKNLMTGYTAWRGHTRIKDDGTVATSHHIPLYVGVQMDGQVVYAMRDGSVVHPFKIPGANNCHDFTFYDPDRKLFFVANTNANEVLKIDRTVTPWAVSRHCAVTRPTSIRNKPGTNEIYIASSEQKILKVVDGVVSDFADLPMVFWLDFMSDGRIVAVTRNVGVYIYGLDGTRTTVKEPLTGAIGWITVSVDRNGTFGPKDEFTIVVMGGVGNVDYWRYQDGQMKYMSQAIPGSFGACTVGNTNNCFDLFGHYVWIAEHHPDEALIMVQGLSDLFPSLIAARPSTYPPGDVYDHNQMGLGRRILRNGTIDSMVGQKPSFTTQIGDCGWSLTGVTADMIAEKSFADAAAFVRQGMLGNHRRDEIAGADMRALLYYLYRSSQRFLKEGKALMDGLKGAPV